MRAWLSAVAITAVGAALFACGGATVEPQGGQAGAPGGSTGGSGAGGAAGQPFVDAGRDALACGVIRASDYDQSCKTTLDCALVFEGDTCTAQCSCPNAPINHIAAAGYRPVFEHPNVCNCPMMPPPWCVDGVCAVCPVSGCPAKDSGASGSGGGGGAKPVDAGRDAPACGVIRASDFDRSCTVDTDCTGVVEGDTCAMQCDCVNAAISKAALDKYDSAFATPPYEVCLCVMMGVPRCAGGVCTL
jgi:hypothetical protein